MRPDEVDNMLGEIADGLRANNDEVFYWLHGQLKECGGSEMATALAMGVICNLLPYFRDRPAHRLH